MTLGFVPALPLVVAGWAVAARRPKTSSVPAVGWTLLVAALATAGLLVWISRA